ncbi:MAG: tetratricopeptide repeat protein [Planctomycetes bacterium]|nr:tetratricopeptide repeat protein [Planctomycetota bacterium]
MAAIAAAHGENSLRYAAALHALALVHRARGQLDDAIDLHEQVVEVRSQLQPDSLALATALQNLAHALQLADRQEQALTTCREALAIQRRVHGERLHKDLGFSLDVEGSLLRYLGRQTEALTCFAEAERHFVGHCGADHPDVAVCLTEWGITLEQLDRSAEAVPLLRRALAIRRQHDPDGSAAHAATLEALALASIGVNPIGEAVAFAGQALAMRTAVHGAGHPLRLRAMEALGTTLLHAERWAECEAVGRELLAIRRRDLGDEHWLTWAHASMVWIPLARRGEHKEALELATLAVAGLERGAAPPVRWLRHALEAQRDLAQLANRPELLAAANDKLAALPPR